MTRRTATFPAALLAATLATAAPAHAQTDTDILLLQLMHRNGDVLVVGAPARVTDRDGYDNQPLFTPDGAALLYTSIRDGQADSYMYDIRAGRSVRLTRTAESEYSPTPVPGSARFSVVRVEADSTQRLWSFAADGTDPRLVLSDVQPVGYHAWIDDDRLALFVLGDPPTLRIAAVSTGRARTVARGIGRSIQTLPGGAAISFTQTVGDDWWIRVLDPARRTVRSEARLPTPDGYHAWTPDGALLSADGTRIVQWERRGLGGWRVIGDVADHGFGAISRLAVSPDGSRLAVVVDRNPPPPDPDSP